MRKYTPDGRLLWKLGTSGRGSDTGVQESDYRTITRGGPPFNQPTNLAIGAGWIALHFRWLWERPHPQVLVRRQAAALLGRAGRPGRGNSTCRTELASIPAAGCWWPIVKTAAFRSSRPMANYLTEWTDVVRPCEVFVDPQDNVYVAELGRRAGMFPWMTPDLTVSGGRISIFNPQRQSAGSFRRR